MVTLILSDDHAYQDLLKLLHHLITVSVLFAVIYISLLLTGADEQQSYRRNMVNWLHKVAEEYPLPCNADWTSKSLSVVITIYKKMSWKSIYSFAGENDEMGGDRVRRLANSSVAIKAVPKGRGPDLCLSTHRSFFGLMVPVLCF